jgi:hypothetical protein
MKKSILLIFTLLIVSFWSTAQDVDIDALLDQAVALQEKGDNTALASTLSTSVEKLEKEANTSNGDFKDKLLGSIGGLKSMIPLASKGLVKQNGLQKIVSTIKLLLGANRLSSMLGGNKSLLGQASGLTSNLGLMKMGLSAMGGSSDKLGGFIGTAMSGVGQLEKGGVGAKTAEPALKKQLGGILDMVKGAAF